VSPDPCDRESLSESSSRVDLQPSSVDVERRRLLALSGGLFSTVAAGCLSEGESTPTEPSGQSEPQSPAAGGLTSTEEAVNLSRADHRQANPGITAWICASHDGTTYVPTRRGNPVKAGAFDLESESVTQTYDLPSGYQAQAVEGHGKYVYVANSGNGAVFQIDTETDEVRELGQTGRYVQGISVAPDGTVYVGGSGQGHLYEVDPDSGEFTDHGPVADTEKYCTDLFATEDFVLAALGNQENSGIYEFDRETGEITQHFEGEVTDWMKKFDASEEFIVCHGDYERSFVIDRQSRSNGTYGSFHAVETLPGRFGIGSDPELVYYAALPKAAKEWPEEHPAQGIDTPALYTYNMRTQEHTKAFDLDQAIAEDGLNYRSTHVYEGQFIGVQRVGAGNLAVVDLESESTDIYDLEEAGMEPTPGTNQAMGEFRGMPVTSRNDGVFIYDLEADSITELTIDGEAKRMVDVGDDLYITTYTGAHFWVYDGDELRRIGTADGQVRPKDLVYHEPTSSLAMGTQPNYGAATGGAVSMLDIESESVSTYQNVVENQSINSVASVGEDVFVGTDIGRGQGTEPVTSEAQVGRFDPDAGEVTWTTVPVEGKTRVMTLSGVGDGAFGIANSAWSEGTFFTVDANSQTVTDTADIGYATRFEEGPDGRYYGVVGSTRPPGGAWDKTSGGLVVYDPEENRVTRYHGDEKVFSFLGEVEIIDDAIYYVDSDEWRLKSISGLSEF
jgi:hypothetical protein